MTDYKQAQSNTTDYDEKISDRLSELTAPEVLHEKIDQQSEALKKSHLQKLALDPNCSINNIMKRIINSGI